MRTGLPHSISSVTTAPTTAIFLHAFDLIELNGDDLRRDPLEVRKATLASIVAKASSGIRFNEHIEGDGPTVFAHACKLGLEGIVSKRRDSAWRSGALTFVRPHMRVPETPPLPSGGVFVFFGR